MVGYIFLFFAGPSYSLHLKQALLYPELRLSSPAQP